MIQFILAKMSAALAVLRPNEGDFADTWEIGRNFSKKAEKYMAVRAEIKDRRRLERTPLTRAPRDET